MGLHDVISGDQFTLTGSSLPSRRLRKVDFPTPFGPTIATAWRRGERERGRGRGRRRGRGRERGRGYLLTPC